MSQLTNMLSPEDLRNVDKLEIVARQVVEGFCAGLHQSPHKGFSVEFRQHRQYVHGDEIRHIDWKAFGKTDRYYIREYEEETNLKAILLLDKSGSMNYAGGNRMTKLEYAVRTAACLAYMMLRQADAVGLVTFDEDIDTHIPPRSRPGHLGILLDKLSAVQPGGETEPGKVFHDLVPKIHKRGLLIVLSDCFGDLQELLGSLAHFRHAHHEIVVFQILDPDELQFPFIEWTRFESLENPAHARMVDPGQLRNAYLERLGEFREELRRGCHNHRIDLVTMSTDRPYSMALAEYLSLRRHYG